MDDVSLSSGNGDHTGASQGPVHGQGAGQGRLESHSFCTISTLLLLSTVVAGSLPGVQKAHGSA
ncbi:hypothetical protein [Streptomyces sp. NPDC054866]